MGFMVAWWWMKCFTSEVGVVLGRAADPWRTTSSLRSQSESPKREFLPHQREVHVRVGLWTSESARAQKRMEPFGPDPPMQFQRLSPLRT